MTMIFWLFCVLQFEFGTYLLVAVVYSPRTPSAYLKPLSGDRLRSLPRVSQTVPGTSEHSYLPKGLLAVVRIAKKYYDFYTNKPIW
jgi:hypothetical protein